MPSFFPAPKGPAELHSGIPRELEKIVLRCLRKDPAWHFQSAADLKISLHDLPGEIESAPCSPVISGRQLGLRSYFWIGALAAGLSISSATSWWIASRRPSEPSTQGRVRPLTTYSGLEYDPALSPDGNRIAFSWNGEKKDNFDIYVRLVDGRAALRLTTDARPTGRQCGRPTAAKSLFFVEMRSIWSRHSAVWSAGYCSSRGARYLSTRYRGRPTESC